jgi:DNA-binding response OmpR family regulator
LTKPLALIVEDDYDLATIFDEALKAADFKTEVIRTGNAAMERLAAVSPAVVVLDLHLPQVAGTDILDQIRADERLTQTRVIVTTADVRLAETLHEKADLVLVKPISFSQLRDLAKRLRNM